MKKCRRCGYEQPLHEQDFDPYTEVMKDLSFALLLIGVLIAGTFGINYLLKLVGLG